MQRSGCQCRLQATSQLEPLRTQAPNTELNIRSTLHPHGPPCIHMVHPTATWSTLHQHGPLYIHIVYLYPYGPPYIHMVQPTYTHPLFYLLSLATTGPFSLLSGFRCHSSDKTILLGTGSTHYVFAHWPVMYLM